MHLANADGFATGVDACVGAVRLRPHLELIAAGRTVRVGTIDINGLSISRGDKSISWRGAEIGPLGSAGFEIYRSNERGTVRLLHSIKVLYGNDSNIALVFDLAKALVRASA